jgi:subtilisin family serine protease
VADAVAHNVVVVAASGDTNLGGTAPEEPATCAGVLAVGGVESSGKLWPDSTQGSNVSVVAPSYQMYVVGRDGEDSSTGQGTSFAAPLVSAAAALIRSRYPSMPWWRVDQRIIQTAIRTGSGVPNDSYGYGIMNIGEALNASKYPVPVSSARPQYTDYVSWLQTSVGQAWAADNDVTVPGAGSSSAATAPASKNAVPAPSSTAKKSSGSGALIGIIIVVVILIAGVVILLARRRSRGPSQQE